MVSVFIFAGVSCVVVLEVCVTGVYYPYMASIVGKRRGKQTYYYLVESARVRASPASCPSSTWAVRTR